MGSQRGKILHRKSPVMAPDHFRSVETDGPKWLADGCNYFMS
jgi:hypothetical protein